MSSRRGEITIFSTSFLDLLSCGMGAVIILLIIFISQLQVETKDALPFAVVVIAVDYGQDDGRHYQETLFVNDQALWQPANADRFQIRENDKWKTVPVNQSAAGSLKQQASFDAVEFTKSFRDLRNTGPRHHFPYRITLRNWIVLERTRYYSTRGRHSYNLTLRNLKGKARVIFQWRRRVFPKDKLRSFIEPDGQANLTQEVPFPKDGKWFMGREITTGTLVFSCPLQVHVSIHASTSPLSEGEIFSGSSSGAGGPLEWTFFEEENRTLAEAERMELRITLDEELQLRDPVRFIEH